ncbi:MAG: type III-B CRISPR module RAMP protein Cmr4 [Anaerolineales bacterium]
MYTLQRFVLMTLDPVHIGTGGYRLGRVDLSIVREPGTNLPKVPGTSLSGAIRQYAAIRYEKINCAGQKGCGKSECPICYTFGSAKESGGGYAGTVSIFDARLLFFPVHTLAGPAWVTSPSALADFGIKGQSVSDDRAKWPDSLTSNSRINLGWLMLERDNGNWQPPQEIPQEIKDRLVLVPDKLFPQIVNSNLEVRTSVSIDPQTGAALEGALFTYEALPRTTWLWFDVVEDDYRKDKQVPWPVTKKFLKTNAADEGQENAGEDLGETWKRPLNVVRAGIKLAEYLGVGGMGTRGFGRIRLISDWEVNNAQP